MAVGQSIHVSTVKLLSGASPLPQKAKKADLLGMHGYFWLGRLPDLSKVTRCKSETDISHNPNTGYIPNLKNTPSQSDARQRYTQKTHHTWP